MKEQIRGSGVLMHISSLWGEYGCGQFGLAAREFIDFLADCGFTYWQTLPFCLPDGFASPYSSYGAFSVNPDFIDLEQLRDVGLLTEEELESAKQKAPYVTEFERLRAERLPLLAAAAARFRPGDDYEAFFQTHNRTGQFCRFMACKEANGGKPFWEWESEEEDPGALRTWKFVCYIFFRQWKQVKDYAAQKGIRLVGDIPIYVSLDSADVWANRGQFLLDERLRPTRVAGVPPDYFCPDGQLWGNPLYDWGAMEKDGFSWWKERVAFMCELFDCVRIDHFRGIEAFYAIPYGAPDARKGKWIKGPGMKFIRAAKEAAQEKCLIAEDLGVDTPGLQKLLRQSGLPRMHVLQFGFPVGAGGSSHLPHTYEHNCVAYTGTHDNNTLLGVVWEMDEGAREELFRYCGYPYTRDNWDRKEAYETVMHALLASVADRVIFPMQDVLCYGSDTRMNRPGVAQGNWSWRMTREQINGVDRARWAYFNRLYERIAPEEEPEEETKD